ncbi:hypothetical protein [Brevundimonas sp. 2YAF1]|uniref:hypothetical protein n=1 Tax=Brevundimonas sp. 2YAF1 TaxID=3233024 RepID=UPI003F925DF8
MRRPPITAAILTAGACALGLGAPAAAQTSPAPSSANAAGLRYLTWPGRSYSPVAVAEAARAVEAAPTAAVRRPPIIPHGGQPAPEAALAPAPSREARQGLTPASAWIGSQTPAYQPQPAAPVEAAAPWSPARAVASSSAAPAPTAYFAATAEAAPPPMPVAPPVAAPAPHPVRAPVSTPAPEAAALASPASDPMAPRRDAPIFRLQRPAPAPDAAPQAAPQVQAQIQPASAADARAPAAQGGARYYSVHRQNGRQPDATPLPAPIYLDALPVDLASMPASSDLAAPPSAPNLIRNANGRLQALPANEDPTLP